jgi:hypothetical protein
MSDEHGAIFTGLRKLPLQDTGRAEGSGRNNNEARSLDKRRFWDAISRASYSIVDVFNSYSTISSVHRNLASTEG